MKVVVAGGGFGGIKAAIELAKLGMEDVTLISTGYDFVLHATLYSTAAGRDERESVIPIKEVLSDYPGITFIKDRVVKIDGNAHTIFGDNANYQYDNLILAVGTVSSPYSIDEQEKHIHSIASLQSTRELRKSFHEILTTNSPGQTHCMIVGGGLAGVELSGALNDYAQRIKEAHRLKNTEIRITLIEAGNRILPSCSKTASKKVTEHLAGHGVKIITNQKIDKITKNSVVINEKNTPVDMTISTVGRQNNSLFKAHPDLFKLSARNKVIVNQQMLAYPDIYVIGDNAETKHSGLASTAIKDAVFVSKNIHRQSKGNLMKSRFRVRSPLLSIPVTGSWGYIEYDGVYVAGLPGAWVRRLVELNYYSYFFGVSKAFNLWRMRRKNSADCRLCIKHDAE